MASRFSRVIRTVFIKIFQHKSIQTEGFLDIHRDTKLKTSHGGTMKLGKNLSTFTNVFLTSNGGRLVIGNNVFFNRYCIVVCMESIEIGDNCIFGPGICIYDHDHKFDYDGVKNEYYNKSPIIIGKNCWIGANAVILRGSHVGEGCVIGAGTVVSGHIPPHSLVTGSRENIIKPIEGKEIK